MTSLCSLTIDLSRFCQAFLNFLERIIYNRLLGYWTNLGILCDSQFGFRTNHSTTLSLIDSGSRRFSSWCLFRSLKSLRHVNHSILFDKLEHYGIRGLALKWIKSYFSNTVQFVDYNGHVSSRSDISCGVPQGSILGPLFFLLYINDINNASTLLQLIYLLMIPTFFCLIKIQTAWSIN